MNDQISPEEFELASETLKVHRDRIHQHQDMRWSWQKYSAVSSFAFFSWFLSYQTDFENNEKLFIAVWIPFVFNLLGYITVLGLQQSIVTRAKFVEELEAEIHKKTKGWQQYWRDVERDRGIGVSWNRRAIHFFWMAMILISISFGFLARP